MPKLEPAPTLGLDDGAGLRVVRARYLEEEGFDWTLFEGFESLRVLTYSASAGAIVKVLDDFSFRRFECVFGSEATLGNMVKVLAFQKVAAEGTRAAIMGLKDERHHRILEKVAARQATFRVLRGSVAHAKLFLLAGGDRTRVIVGSANLSERAFAGQQPETLVVFDDDEPAWQHYSRMFDAIRDSGSDEISLPEHRISRAGIEVPETPVLSDDSTTVVIKPITATDAETSAPAQVERIEKIATVLRPRLSAALPPLRAGRQRITPRVKRELSRIRLVKSTDESRPVPIDRSGESHGRAFG